MVATDIRPLGLERTVAVEPLGWGWWFLKGSILLDSGVVIAFDGDYSHDELRRRRVAITVSERRRRCGLLSGRATILGLASFMPREGVTLVKEAMNSLVWPRPWLCDHPLGNCNGSETVPLPEAAASSSPRCRTCGLEIPGQGYQGAREVLASMISILGLSSRFQADRSCLISAWRPSSRGTSSAS